MLASRQDSNGLGAGSYILIGIIGICLVAGYVVLAALGRDVTGYVLFLGGPAVTGVVGAILNKRVSNVQETVGQTQVETKALVTEAVSGVDDHLHEQDKTLGQIAAATQAEPPAAPAAGQLLPAARQAPTSLFGPVQSGLVTPRRRE